MMMLLVWTTLMTMQRDTEILSMMMLLAWTTLMTKQRDRGRVANTRSSEQHTSTVAHSPCASSQATCDWSVSLILSSDWLWLV